MPRSKPQPKPAQPPTVSARWLLTAIAIAVPAAAFCAWAVLCLLFWQGSWQLLYHPTSAVSRTPAAIALPFNPVGFAPTDTGAPQLQGWWIAVPSPRYTALYLHGADGNLGNTLDTLANLHNAGLNVLAFDYRGYGQSLFAHPSEARMSQDAESALAYLSATRHIDPRTIVLCGSSLGANLALELAAAHPELAGVILDSPLAKPVDAIFEDPRARLVPARLLVSDRFDTAAPAASLRIPSLWFFKNSPSAQSGSPQASAAFQKVTARKTQLWLPASPNSNQEFTTALSRWLGDLNK
jgi:pimeloyl-ACP methyl ester carboxylesterase